MTASARLRLPFLAPGQSQKELFHNEALQLLDIIVQPVVEGSPSDTPPSSPQTGSTYLVGPQPTADWADHANALACMTEGGWRFLEAFEGMETRDRQSGEKFSFVNGVWQLGILNVRAVRVEGQQVLSGRGPAIATPTGGTVVDAQARAVLASVLGALRQHGLIAAA